MADVAASADGLFSVHEGEAGATAASRPTPCLLHALAGGGDRDAVLELLDGGGVAGEELNQRGPDGLTPLHSAIQGRVRSAQKLCRRVARFHATLLPKFCATLCFPFLTN